MAQFLIVMGEPDIDIAIKAFEEARSHTDHSDLYRYDLLVGLLALSRAIKEIQEKLEHADDVKKG